jgi:hypothetical protein
VRSPVQEEDEIIPIESNQTVALGRASSLGVMKLFAAHPRNLDEPTVSIRKY